MTAPDVVDALAGSRPGSRLDHIRAGRPQARENAQASYLAPWRASPGWMRPGCGRGSRMTGIVLTHEGIEVPAASPSAELGWLPWLEPLPADEPTHRHRAALVDPARARSP